MRDLVADGHRVAVHVADDPTRPRASTHGSSSPPPPRRCATGSTSRTCSPASPSSTRETTWIEPTVTLAPDAVVHPFTSLAGPYERRRGRRDRPACRRRRRRDRSGGVVGPFCYVRPGTVLGARSKAGTFVELKNTRLDEGAKVPHLSYFGDAEVGAGTNVGRGIDHGELRPPARRAEEADGDRHATRGSPSTRCSSPRSRWATMSGRRPAPSSPRMSRTTLSSGSRRGRRSRRVGVESGTVEQTLPGLGRARHAGHGPRRRACDRPDAEQAADARRRPLEPGAGAARSRTRSAASSAR